MLSDVERDHHAEVVFGRSEAVDAADGGDDDDIGAADECAGGKESESVDFLIDGGIFFDVDVALRDVGFGLVVVVVTDEVGDGVIWEEIAEFGVELSGESFVM